MSAEVEVPNFSLIPSTDKETYNQGEPVKITVGVANLQASGNLNLTLTTTTDLLGYKPFQITEPITVPANSLMEYHYTWDETRTRGGTYNLMADVGEGTGALTQFTLPFGAEFTGQPLTGTVPLSVTFTDLSTPWGGVETWQWDFGDGTSTITETDPIHIYTTPGIYTVTLTTTVGLSAYMEIKPNYITAISKTR